MTIDKAKKLFELKLGCHYASGNICKMAEDNGCENCPYDYDIDLIPNATEVALKTFDKIEKIADIVEGTIDHCDRDDLYDMIMEIKDVIKR